MGTGIVRLCGVAVLCLALAGCGAVGGESRTATWRPAPSPSPSAGPDDVVNSLYEALMSGSDFEKGGVAAGISMTTQPSEEIDEDPPRPCEKKLDSDGDRRDAVQSLAYSKKENVTHRTFGYWEVDAAAVVAELEQVARRCKSYQVSSHRGRATVTVASGGELPKLDGVETWYAYCENFASGGYTWTVCHAAMARGKVLSMLEVNRAEEQPTRDLMRKLAPVAADLLVSATEGS